MELPTIQAEHWHSPSHFELEFALAPEASCFRGHFEQAPVLAGVVQLGWAFTLAERKLNQQWHFRGMKSAKFQRLILPPVSLQLSVEFFPPRQMFKFVYRDTRGIYSTGGVSVSNRG